MRTLLRLLSRFVAFLPLGVALWLGRAWGFFFARIVRRRRAEILEALARSLPDKTPEERNRIATRAYENSGMVAIEVLRMAVEPTTALAGRVDPGSTFEAIRRESENGKGMLLISAHLDNWEVLAAATAAGGFKTAIVVKSLKPASLNNFIIQARERYGTLVLQRKGAMRSILRHLRNGGILGFMMDQNTKRNEGVFVDFLGRPACTTLGLAQLAVMTGVRAMPVFLVRKPGGQHLMIHGEPIDPPADLSETEVTKYTQKAVDSVASAVRAHPEQWIWMHRRWRTQPLPDESSPSVPVES